MQLVLLHALPFDASMWAAQGELFVTSASVPALVPTLYEQGDTVQDWAEAVLQRATDEQLIVVGNSIGGSCALEMAALAPERVSAVVMIGAKAGHRPQPELRDAAVRLLRNEGIDAAWSSLWAPLFGSHADPAVVESARAIANRQHVDDLVRGIEAFHARRDLDAFAASWDRPIVVINGDQDSSPSPQTAAALALAAPCGVLQIVPDCGHYVSMERPDAFATALGAVLRWHASAAG